MMKKMNAVKRMTSLALAFGMLLCGCGGAPQTPPAATSTPSSRAANRLTVCRLPAIRHRRKAAVRYPVTR